MVTSDDDDSLLDDFLPINFDIPIEHVVTSTTTDMFKDRPNNDESPFNHTCNSSTSLSYLPITYEDSLNDTSKISANGKYKKNIAAYFGMVPSFSLQKLSYDTLNKCTGLQITFTRDNCFTVLPNPNSSEVKKIKYWRKCYSQILLLSLMK